MLGASVSCELSATYMSLLSAELVIILFVALRPHTMQRSCSASIL